MELGNEKIKDTQEVTSPIREMGESLLEFGFGIIESQGGSYLLSAMVRVTTPPISLSLQ